MLALTTSKVGASFCFWNRYALTGHLTTKSDVYNYGVVLLELLTGRVPVDLKRAPGEGVLVSWVLPRLTVGEKIVEIMDPSLEGQYSLKEPIQVAATAALCVQSNADYRPLMAHVVHSLLSLVKHHRPPTSVKVANCSSFDAGKSPAKSECARSEM